MAQPVQRILKEKKLHAFHYPRAFKKRRLFSKKEILRKFFKKSRSRSQIQDGIEPQMPELCVTAYLNEQFPMDRTVQTNTLACKSSTSILWIFFLVLLQGFNL